MLHVLFFVSIYMADGEPDTYIKSARYKTHDECQTKADELTARAKKDGIPGAAFCSADGASS